MLTKHGNLLSTIHKQTGSRVFLNSKDNILYTQGDENNAVIPLLSELKQSIQTSNTDEDELNELELPAFVRESKSSILSAPQHNMSLPFENTERTRIIDLEDLYHQILGHDGRKLQLLAREVESDSFRVDR
eukprot:UN05883